MFVITGATGNVGGKIADILLERGHAVRVVGRSMDRLGRLIAAGAEPAVGDLADKRFLTGAFTGAAAVFAVIPPNVTAENFRAYQSRIGESIAGAIKEAGVTHVVNLSSQGAHLSEGTGPIKGMYDQEKRLNAIPGLNVLHLRPTFFMENLLMQMPLIEGRGIMGSAIRGDVRFAMIATKDIAAYAADRLAKLDFSGSTVRDLLGQRDLSLEEAARIIGRRIGKPGLAYVQFSPEDAEKGLISMGVSPDVSKEYVEMGLALNAGRFGVYLPRTAENTTPTSIEDFAGVFAELYTSKAAA